SPSSGKASRSRLVAISTISARIAPSKMTDATAAAMVTTRSRSTGRSRARALMPDVSTSTWTGVETRGCLPAGATGPPRPRRSPATGGSEPDHEEGRRQLHRDRRRHQRAGEDRPRPEQPGEDERREQEPVGVPGERLESEGTGHNGEDRGGDEAATRQEPTGRHEGDRETGRGPQGHRRVSQEGHWPPDD